MDRNFIQQVKIQSGINFDRCYQCLTCSLGCPFSFAMDYLPNQIIRKIQWGERNEVLQSKAIWQCASCETCVTRCPNQIDLPRIMDTLRQLALQSGITPGDKAVPVFHKAFLKGIQQWSRQYELGMLLSYKFKSRDFFSDINLGIRLLRKRKLRLLPGRNPGRRDIKILFRKLRGTG